LEIRIGDLGLEGPKNTPALTHVLAICYTYKDVTPQLNVAGPEDV